MEVNLDWRVDTLMFNEIVEKVTRPRNLLDKAHRTSLRLRDNQGRILKRRWTLRQEGVRPDVTLHLLASGFELPGGRIAGCWL